MPLWNFSAGVFHILTYKEASMSRSIRIPVRKAVFGLVLAAMVLAGCSGGGSSSSNTVDSLDLSSQVTAPVAGGTPVTTAINNAQYKGSVAWQDSSGGAFAGTFAAASVYKAQLTLTAQNGYTFAGVKANSFTYSYTGAAVTNAANSGAVTITFPALSAPLSVTKGNKGELIVTWTPVAGAASYEVLSNTGTTPGAASSGIPVDGTTYTLTGLDDGTEYTVWVRSVDAAGVKGEWISGTGATRSGEKNITLFKIGGHSGTIIGTTITLTVPAAVTDFDPEITVSAGASAAYKSGSAAFPGAAVYTVTAENGDTQDYTITVTQTGAGNIGFIFTDESGGLSNQTGPIVLTGSETITVSTESGWSDYQWYVDNELRGIAAAFVLDATDYDPGVYELVLVAKDSGSVYWSKGFPFTIE
jgi:hypothetical protein